MQTSARGMQASEMRMPMRGKPNQFCFVMIFILLRNDRSKRIEWAGPDSNRGPNDYESLALTAELPAL